MCDDWIERPKKKFEILRLVGDYYGIDTTVRAYGTDDAVEQVADRCFNGERILVRFKKLGGISVYEVHHHPSFTFTRLNNL